MNAELVERVRQRLADTGMPPSVAGLALLVRDEAGRFVDHAERLNLLAQTEAEVSGAGPLDPLLRDPDTTDVLVNGAGQVWIDRGGGVELTTASFPDDQAVRRLAQRLAAQAGRRLDDGSPWVDAVLADGTRLHAVLHPVSFGGTCLSLRTFRPRGFDLRELVELGTVDPELAEVLRDVVRARLAFLVTGGTGSGKTTLLATVLGLLPAGERVVVVEDAAELRPTHDHVVRLTGRPPNLEGAGEVTLRDLVRQALRMRPDRLVVGEVRGAEVVELLTALNTGHDGGAGTLHANSVTELPARLEALASLGGLDRAALHSQLAAAVQVALHLERRADGSRVLAEVGLLRRSGGLVSVAPAWRLPAGRGEAWADLRMLISNRLSRLDAS